MNDILDLLVVLAAVIGFFTIVVLMIVVAGGLVPLVEKVGEHFARRLNEWLGRR